jgi:hypothetical protein
MAFREVFANAFANASELLCAESARTFEGDARFFRVRCHVATCTLSLEPVEQPAGVAAHAAPATVGDDAGRQVTPEALEAMLQVNDGTDEKYSDAQEDGEGLSVGELYDEMKHTRVLWSFGTARGGVNLAIELQERLTDWHIVLNEKQLMVSPGNTRHWRIKAHAGQSIKWTFRECDQHKLDFRSCFVHAETQQGEEDWHTEMQHTCTATGECMVTRPGGARASPLCLSRLSLLTCACL